MRTAQQIARNRTAAATSASSYYARVRRFQRYLREMRTAGYTVIVTRGHTPAEHGAFNIDPAAFPEPKPQPPERRLP